MRSHQVSNWNQARSFALVILSPNAKLGGRYSLIPGFLTKHAIIVRHNNKLTTEASFWNLHAQCRVHWRYRCHVICSVNRAHCEKWPSNAGVWSILPPKEIISHRLKGAITNKISLAINQSTLLIARVRNSIRWSSFHAFKHQNQKPCKRIHSALISNTSQWHPATNYSAAKRKKCQIAYTARTKESHYPRALCLAAIKPETNPIKWVRRVACFYTQTNDASSIFIWWKFNLLKFFPNFIVRFSLALCPLNCVSALWNVI